MISDNKFYLILKSVRAWAEDQAAKSGFDDDDLMGMCAIVSQKLFKILKKEGYDCLLAYNDNHVFILMQNTVVDLTATQFGKSKIYLSSNTKGHWKVDRVFSSIVALRKHLRKSGWSQDQI